MSIVGCLSLHKFGETIPSTCSFKNIFNYSLVNIMEILLFLFFIPIKRPYFISLPFLLFSTCWLSFEIIHYYISSILRFCFSNKNWHLKFNKWVIEFTDHLSTLMSNLSTKKGFLAKSQKRKCPWGWWVSWEKAEKQGMHFSTNSDPGSLCLLGRFTLLSWKVYGYLT